MRLPYHCTLVMTMFATLVTIPAPLCAQSVSSAQEDAPASARWWSVGFKVRGFPWGLLDGRLLERSDAGVAASQTFTTTPSSPHLGLGPAVDFTLNRKLTLRTEILFHRLSYTQATEKYTGTDDPTTDSDERSKTSTLTQRTKATLWDLPLMVRYQGLRQGGALSRMYLSAGGSWRTMANIRTGTETVFPDGKSAYHEAPITPARRNLAGIAAGIGFLFVDDFNIKVTPELRYTRWFGSSLSVESTRSRSSQIEWGVGVTF